MQNCMSGRKPQPTTQIEKGVTMPALDAVDTDQTDWSGPLTNTSTLSLEAKARFSVSTWLEDDFLTWSIRQKDAEIIMDYDV